MTKHGELEPNENYSIISKQLKRNDKPWRVGTPRELLYGTYQRTKLKIDEKIGTQQSEECLIVMSSLFGIARVSISTQTVISDKKQRLKIYLISFIRAVHLQFKRLRPHGYCLAWRKPRCQTYDQKLKCPKLHKTSFINAQQCFPRFVPRSYICFARK